MTRFQVCSLTVLLSIASGACLAAETPPTQSPADKTAPSAASSPHQRDATATGAAEAPSAQTDPAAAATPTPHQKQVTEKGQAGKFVTPQSFVSQAGVIGKAEVELGQIALKNTQDENVRKYAERMVKDHGAADKKLKAIAAKENLQVPQALDQEHESLKMKLQGMTGSQFDREYMKAMAKGHEKAVALFDAASQQPQMPAELKQFAASTLPVLEQHKEMAHSMHEK
jgi:putative membrane protein